MKISTISDKAKRRASYSKEAKPLRVIPVLRQIAVEQTIMPYDSAEEIIRGQSKIVVSDCICRTVETYLRMAGERGKW